MANHILRLDIDDVTGPGLVGEILVRPLLSGNNGTHWQSNSAGRIPLKYNDPAHSASDPAYDPEYTILGAGKWEPLIQGAYYEFTVLRVNNTIVRPLVAVVAQMPATGSGDFSDLAFVPAPLPSPVDLIDSAIAYTILNGADTKEALRKQRAGAVTYNPDGTVATSTLDGVVTTYTYNVDGTLHTESRDGETTTYVYSSGALSSWSVA